ncbi:hypothetical protein [Salinactinospora qingdaonensis]|uniref:Uncharacterized protein n=1 Tax=Salinactinospora qingdaonensis TaxID=702744 RepID=A0ABP7G699_9ACTN
MSVVVLIAAKAVTYVSCKGVTMVFASRQQRERPAGAARGSLAPTVLRLLTLGGIAAAGWLLGGAGSALAEDAPLEPATVALGQAVDAAAEGATSASPVGGAVDSALKGDSAAVVTSVADEADEAVSDTVEAGRGISSHADRSLQAGTAALTEGVSRGLAGSTEGVASGVRQTVDNASTGDAISGITGAESAGSDRSAPTSNGDAAEAPQTESAPAESRGAERAGADREVSSAGAASADTSTEGAADVPAPEDVPTFNIVASGKETSAGRVDLAGEETPASAPLWPHSSESSATTSSVSSVSVPGATPPAFLASRIDSLRPVAHRVSLPAAPAFVARYAADDPSFSPD